MMPRLTARCRPGLLLVAGVLLLIVIAAKGQAGVPDGTSVVVAESGLHRLDVLAEMLADDGRTAVVDSRLAGREVYVTGGEWDKRQLRGAVALAVAGDWRTLADVDFLTMAGRSQDPAPPPEMAGRVAASFAAHYHAAARSLDAAQLAAMTAPAGLPGELLTPSQRVWLVGLIARAPTYADNPEPMLTHAQIGQAKLRLRCGIGIQLSSCVDLTQDGDAAPLLLPVGTRVLHTWFDPIPTSADLY